MPTFTRPFAVTNLASGLGAALEYEVRSTDDTTVLISRRSTGVAEVLGSGTYRVAVAAFDTAWAGYIRWTTAAGATLEAYDEFQAVDTLASGAVLYGSAGSLSVTYTVFDTDGLTPLPGVAVYLSSDLAGSLRSDTRLTDSLGRTVWQLDPGDFYAWRSHPERTFTNPDGPETVS